MTKNIFIILIPIFYPAFLIGQNFKEDILLLRKKFSGSYSVNIKTKVVSNDPHFPNAVLSGFIKVKDSLMNYKQGEEEILYAKNYLLIISHQEKNIIVDTAADEYNEAPLYFLDLDTLEKSYKEVLFSNANNKKVYTIIPVDGEVEKFTITIDASGNLEKVEISISEEDGGGSAEIYYSAFIQNPRFETDTFSVWRFVQRNAGKFIPTEKFKTYTVDSNI